LTLSSVFRPGVASTSFSASASACACAGARVGYRSNSLKRVTKENFAHDTSVMGALSDKFGIWILCPLEVTLIMISLALWVFVARAKLR
jgi:hypothetical protein